MKTTNTYLVQLQKYLNGLSAKARADILAEIESHIDEGLQDPDMGRTVKEREEKLMAELGSPSDMGNGFNHTHYRHRWLDVVLALVPAVVIFVGKALITGATMDMLLGWLAVLPIYLGMLYLSLRRQSLMLLGWWLAWTILYTTQSWMISTDSGENLFNVTKNVKWIITAGYSALLLGSLYYFGRKLWEWRHNGLLVGFSLQPIIWKLVSFALGVITIRLTTPAAFGEFAYLLGVIEAPLYVFMVVLVMSPMSRRLRWYALILSALGCAVTNLVIWQSVPSIFSVLGTLTIAASIIGGLILDYRFTNHNPLVST